MRYFWDTGRPEAGLGLWLEDFFICYNILTISFLAGAAISPATAITILVIFVAISRLTDLRGNEAFRLIANVIAMFAALGLASILIGRISEAKRALFYLYNLAVLPASLLFMLVPLYHFFLKGGAGLARRLRMAARGLASIANIATAIFYLAAVGSVSISDAAIYALGLFASMLMVTFFNSDTLAFLVLLGGCAASVYLGMYSGQIPSGPVILALAAVAALLLAGRNQA